MEQYLAEVVQDALIDQIPLPAEQRDQIQLEVTTTTSDHLYNVHVYSCSDPEKSLPRFCVRQDDDEHSSMKHG
jgi:hypothetical protein